MILPAFLLEEKMDNRFLYQSSFFRFFVDFSILLCFSAIASVDAVASVVEKGNLSSVYCHCALHETSGTCQSDNTCKSLTGICQVNVWYYQNEQKFNLTHFGCLKPSSHRNPRIFTSRGGGGPYSAIFQMNLCNESLCNKYDEGDLHKYLIPLICNYTAYNVQEDTYLKEVWTFCQQLQPVRVGPFSLFHFVIILCIPLAVSLVIVVGLLMYTRHINNCRCSLAACKHVFLSTFLPKGFSAQNNRTKNRRTSRLTGDTAAQQPILEVPTITQQTPTTTTVNNSSTTDSGVVANSVRRNSPARFIVGSVTNSSQGNETTVSFVPASSIHQRRFSPPTEVVDEVTTTNSGSGAGAPTLSRRSMSSQIHLFEVIGRGRYGVVHRGKMFLDCVAVKIFQSRDEQAWLREREIYTTHGMQHDHILAFRGADSRDAGISTELWLVTQFHANGSLFDFLQNRTIHLKTAMKMIYSIVDGLSYLHLEITATPSKPAIAHRDIKSRNILIKGNLTCCLADFGFAVTCAGDNLEQSPAASKVAMVGTRRYMANEILSKSFDSTRFTSFAAADLYALGLVLWELLRRVELDPQKAQSDPYALPFSEFGLSGDPSHVDMHRVVVVERHRPTVPPRFRRPEAFLLSNNEEDEISQNNDDITFKCQTAVCLGRIVEELWQESSISRPGALQIKKELWSLWQNKI